MSKPVLLCYSLLDPNQAYLKTAKEVASGREILKGKLNGINNSAACLTMAVRILTRKNYDKRETTVFEALKQTSVKSRFSKHIEVVGNLRRQSILK